MNSLAGSSEIRNKKTCSDAEVSRNTLIKPVEEALAFDVTFGENLFVKNNKK